MKIINLIFSIIIIIIITIIIIIIVEVSRRKQGKSLYLQFTEILTSLSMEAWFRTSGLTLNSYVPLSDLCERRIVIVDWLSVKSKTNRSWTSLATWVVPPLLYLASLNAESNSGVKITSIWSRGEPSRVYVHWRVMLSFSTGYNGLEGVEMKDGACSLRKKKETSFASKEVRLLSGYTSKFLDKRMILHPSTVNWLEQQDVLSTVYLPISSTKTPTSKE